MAIRPQPGPQQKFLESSADIAVYGGAAFGGKTFALLMEPVRHIGNPKFKGVIFRRVSPMITVEGGLWDESLNIYPLLGSVPVEYRREHVFPSGATIRFSHLQHEKNRLDWQGAQVPFFGFDQLENFTRSQFEYVALSRGRTDSGVIPYVRATCNPEPDSFVKEMIDWWIDSDTGLPLSARSGVIRWFVRVNNEYIWADKASELKEPHLDLEPKSLTFISANITDNIIGNKQNPGYIANLQALPLVDRERLLYGNWNVREAAGNFFRRTYFQVIDTPPKTIKKVRYWDRAATKESLSNKNPDWTVGLLLSRDSEGFFYIEHVERLRGTPLEVENTIKRCAVHDGNKTIVGIEQDPGSAGIMEAQYYKRQLAGYNVKINHVTKNKVTRARPVSSQAEAGNIKIIDGYWNRDFFSEIENFPDSAHDDQVDALSGAFNVLTESTGKNYFIG